jgi:predicted DsbA family dithiol-disulfide isomerase
MNSNKIKIEIWSDIMCPFCYIGKRKLDRAMDHYKNAAHFEIEWKSYQLDPDFKKENYAAQGLDTYDRVAQKYGRDRAWSVEMHKNITEQAKAVGLTYNFDNVVAANSFDAHRLSQFAKKNHVGNELEELIFLAYFTEGKDVADLEVLVELGLKVGLDEAEIRSVLSSNAFAEDVKFDISESQKLGVRGVPFFVFDRKLAVSGAQAEELFLETLDKAWETWEGKSSIQLVDAPDAGSCDIDGNCN